MSVSRLPGRYPLIVELLMQRGLLSQTEADSVEKYQIEKKVTPEEALMAAVQMEAKAMSRNIARVYSEHFSLPSLSLDSVDTTTWDVETGQTLGESFMRAHDVLPIGRDQEGLILGVARPDDHDLLTELEFRTGLPISVMVAPIDLVRSSLDRSLGERDIVKEMTEELALAEEEAEDEEGALGFLDLDEQIRATKETHIVRLVNGVLRSAIDDKASDIHLEPTSENLKVRIRIDGVLLDSSQVPRVLALPFVSRLKVLSKMDIAERRNPQDGAINVVVNKKQVDFRVSTCPTIWGEKMVIRILNKDAVPLDLEWMKMTPKQLNDYQNAAFSANGLLLVTGPTGSGKTTTLYATLNKISTSEKNLCTAEDPVEYRFAGINQVHVKPKVGLTFPAVLRSFLRQDPDVIMVGEIRDQETAEICMRAALTGHFVLSTLHTNSALAAVTRLVDMGIEPFLIGSTLRLVQAQRLVRRLCPECKAPVFLDMESRREYGLDATDEVFKPVGCDSCRNNGYQGRAAVFEVVPNLPELRAMIIGKASLTQMEELCRAKGIMLLAEHGMERVREGVTSIEEINRVIISEAEA